MKIILSLWKEIVYTFIVVISCLVALALMILWVCGDHHDHLVLWFAGITLVNIALERLGDHIHWRRS